MNVRTLIGHGEPAGEIVRIAERNDAEIIAIATHAMSGWRRVGFGSVAERVVRTVRCPALTTGA